VLTLKRYGVTTVLVATLALPATAAAQGQDLRNPDRRAPATQERTQDLRNADRRAPSVSAGAQDLRNADRRAPVAVQAAPVEAPAVTSIQLPADGFDWGDAGIGAAGSVALLAMLAGIVLAGVHHRRGPRVTA
jgi:hypothetical protein